MSTVYPQVGGYPQYPQYTPPAYRLYDVGAVFLAAFLGSPLAGTIYPSRAVRGRRASRRSRIPAGANRRSF